MISLSTICIIPALFFWIFVDDVSAESQLIVIGHVGSTAVLPCELPIVDTETQHIKWNTKSGTVFERYGEDTRDGEGYVGRVDVPEDELRKGNCSLVLRSLTLTDAAVYKSYLIVQSVTAKSYQLSSYQLSVIEKNLSNDETNEKSVTEAPSSTGMCPHQLTNLTLLLCLIILLLF